MQFQIQNHMLSMQFRHIHATSAQVPYFENKMEKGVDLVVGRRQKHKAMSWRPCVSKALALLKVAKLNGQWQQLWFSAQAA